MRQRAFTYSAAMVWALALGACGGGTSGGGTVDPPKPIQVARTGQTESKATGDDASMARGVAWPSPRFASTDSGATVVDQLTGLMWAGNDTPVAECGWRFTDVKTWHEALAYVACLNDRSYLGHADWRVPSRWEMRSLVENDGLACDQDARLQWLQAQGFPLPSADATRTFTEFFTSTPMPNTKTCVDNGNRRPVWMVSLCGGSSPGFYDEKVPQRGVWPVRDAAGVVPVAKVPATGVTACYDWTGCGRIDCAGTGQDGETRKGGTWASPRFATNSDTTITDQLTNLVWAPNGNLPNDDPAGAATPITWKDALAAVDALNQKEYLGHHDWRLPNINELVTLALGDIESSTVFEELERIGIQVKDADYWSSTWGTIVSATSSQAAIWTVNMVRGSQYLASADKAALLLVVRDGP